MTPDPLALTGNLGHHDANSAAGEPQVIQAQFTHSPTHPLTHFRMYDKPALMDLVRELALQIGEFKLASGKKSSYYLDCRKVTLDSAGANLIADGMLELLGRQPARRRRRHGHRRRSDHRRHHHRRRPRRQTAPGFIVRKEAKQHGTGRDVEGPVNAGESVVIVEDVVTTGGSSLAAIEKPKPSA